MRDHIYEKNEGERPRFRFIPPNGLFVLLE